MPTRDEILEAFADWATVGDAAEALGCPRGPVRSHRTALAAKGYLETRFVDGVGNQYRATGKRCPRPSRGRTMPYAHDAILRALESGPMTGAQIMKAVGCPYSTFRDAMASLEGRGKIAQVGPSLWGLKRCRPAGRSSARRDASACPATKPCVP